MTSIDFIEWAGEAIDVAGVAIILVGIIKATIEHAIWGRGRSGNDRYRRFRRSVGRSILLGLEFLLAADIIWTVAIEPTYGSLGLLAIVVAIRTFLSLEIELEIDGHLPWQRTDDPERLE